MLAIQQALLLQDESALLELKKEGGSDLDEETLDLALDLVNANYLNVLQSSFAQEIVKDYLNSSSIIENTLSSLPPSQYDAMSLKYLILGVSCLGCFVQNNWTGPALTIPSDVLPGDLTKDEIDQYLFVDGGESIYEIIVSPKLLIAAKSIICFPYEASPTLFSIPWWSIRCLMVQQTIFTDIAPSIRTGIQRYQSTIEESLNAFSTKLSKTLQGAYYIEKGLFYHSHREISNAISCFGIAKHNTGLDIEISGALGKKTKFQKNDTSQLIVRASSSDSSESTGEDIKTAPKEVSQEHELLLKATAFKEEQFHGTSLSLIDQAIVLSILCAMKASNPTKDPLAIEERLAFLHRVSLESKNWMIHSAVLLYKAQIESENIKTFDRALLQMQSLVDQFDDEEPHVKDRMKMIYNLYYPPKHLLRRELGQRYLKFGVAASARNIFRDLCMWEDLIRSHIVLQETEKAIDITKTRLEKKPTPELWCILGELEKNDEHFVTGWNLGNKKFAMAQRLLGKSLLRKGELEKAIESFRLSLDINPLYPGIWFSLGCCYLKTSQWDNAARAFTSCVQQEPDDGEAWSNLSTALQQLGKIHEAFSAIQEGLKQMQNSWKLWENAFLMSLQVGNFSFAVKAINKLLDLRRSSVKFDWIRLLASYVTKSLKEGETSRTVRFQQAQIDALLERTSEVMTANAEVWETYAILHEVTENSEKALDCRQKQVRLLAKEDPARMSNEDFDKLVAAEQSVADLHSKLPGKKPIHAYNLHLRSVIRKTEEYFGSRDSYKDLQTIHENMKQLENELN